MKKTLPLYTLAVLAGCAAEERCPYAKTGQGLTLACPSTPDTWTEITSACSTPTPRAHHAMVFDEARAKTVMFGGYDAQGLLGETWIWDGLGWIQAFPLVQPPPRQEMGAAFDFASDEVVIFGGRANGSNRDDMWAWDGARWTERTPATRPSPRQNGAMASDPDRGVIVLFGGQGDSGLLSDTWEYDGAEWSQITPADPEADGNPASKQHHRMAFDPIERVVVMCGGDAGGDRCWSWNGSSWAARPNLPTSVFGQGAAPHPSGGLGGVVLFGGRTAGAYGTQDTLLSTESATSPLTMTVSPGARFYHSMAYDSVRGVVVVFGGLDPNIDLLDDTWEL